MQSYVSYKFVFFLRFDGYQMSVVFFIAAFFGILTKHVHVIRYVR